MTNTKVCSCCGTFGKTIKVTQGSFFIEFILWCCMFVPGLIYSIWRMTSKYEACAHCGATSLVPPNSIIGQKILKEAREFRRESA